MCFYPSQYEELDLDTLTSELLMRANTSLANQTLDELNVIRDVFQLTSSLATDGNSSVTNNVCCIIIIDSFYMLVLLHSCLSYIGLVMTDL